ncbi:DUF6313 family protein [Cryptosporangium sp. NPDC051539]|uniref:DUF6313 family protein n=1 Tax=Cryptosporangium sp. NPDC051539 TaxID=3363962 RepID=UPI0037A37844
MEPDPPEPSPVEPPPRESVWDLARRALRSREAMSGLVHWLVVRGSIIFALFAIVYVANGLLIGWQSTYDVTLGIRSPGDTSVAWAAWPLSLAGWLAMPAVAGAVAGYVLSVAITNRRQDSIAQKFGGQDV